LQTSVHLPAARPILSAALEVAVYRIVQEALTNISKHARAHTAMVTLEAENDRLILTICDDGVGLPSQPEMGMGLHSMRERAEELGGTLAVRPNTPAGSCIVAQFPLEPGESDGSDPYSDL
jgi:signal transduction histidine kinase